MALSYEKRREQDKKPAVTRRLLSRVMTPRVRGTMRVLTYLTIVSVIAAGLSIRSAYGSVSEQALITGRQLAKLSDITKDSQRLMLNGQPLNIASAVVDKSLDQVLDRFEAICREEGVVARDFREIKGLMTDASAVDAAKRGRLGVLRQQTIDDGVVACVVRSPENGKRPFYEGLAKFGDNWDLAEVGHLRLAYARRVESGDTHVMTLWTDGSFRLDAMIPPADGADAQGSDSATFPRPDSSQRFLSAGAEGLPHGVRIYESKATANEVLSKYVETLPAQGWEQVSIGEDAPEARYFTKGGLDVIVVAQQSGDRSVVSIMETKGF
jgi:hypothetical protein